MQRAYFITATGTDLGKTWLAAGVAGVCRRRGVSVRALKPVMSGFDAGNPAANDAGALLAEVGAGGTAADVAAISPWRFALPLSPDMAAAREGRHIDVAALVAWCRAEIARNEGLLLIEGIGGAMVPLDAVHTVRDWIAALDISVVLVTGSYLGTLSHTLTTLAALRESACIPALLVINESAESTVSLEETVASLTPHLHGVPVRVVRRGDRSGVEQVTDFLLREAA